jgi:hypothetical protein
MQTTGWTGSKNYEEGMTVKRASSSAAGVLTTPTLKPVVQRRPGDFHLRRPVLFRRGRVQVQVYVTTNGTTWLPSGSNIALRRTWSPHQLHHERHGDLQGPPPGDQRFQRTLYLDNWKIEQGLGEPSFLPGYSNRLVTGATA